MKLEHVIANRPTKTIYRLDNRTVKLFDESYHSSDILNEALNLSIVGESGFPAPDFINVERIDGRWAIVTRFIEGDSLLDIIRKHPEKEDECFDRFVDLQLTMQGYTADKLRHHTDKMHGKISKCGLDATTRYELHTRLNSMPRMDKLCHGDFTPGNVIITPENTACVIDWAHATQGNPCADAARTYLRFMLAGYEDWAEKYLALYCQKSDTARQQVQSWLAIVAASQLVKNRPEERELLIRWTHVVEYE